MTQHIDDKTLLDFVSLGENCGHALVSDDDGRWAFTDSGMSPIAEEGGFTETVSIMSIVDPHMWKSSPREAIAYAYLRAQEQS